MHPNFISRTLFALSLGVLVTVAAKADTVVFQSNLSLITTPSPDPNGPRFQLNYNGGLVQGITNTSTGGVLGYNFVYDSVAHAYLNGASSNGGGGSIQLDQAISTVPDPFDTNDNGYFLALDGVYQVSAIQITVPTILGMTYTVTFDWGGTQQIGYTGITTDFLSVGFTGNPDQVTTPVTVATQGFSGWATVTDTFVASVTGNSILSFLAGGTPTGINQEPAMSVLDNIAVTQVTPGTPKGGGSTPEPASLILLSTGLLGIGGAIRARYKNK